MTDWLDDLEELLALLRSDNVTKEKAARQIVGFLYHVTPHLNAASRVLLDGVPDPFGEDGAAGAGSPDQESPDQGCRNARRR